MLATQSGDAATVSGHSLNRRLFMGSSIDSLPVSSGGPLIDRIVRIGGMAKPALFAALRSHGVALNEAAETLFAQDTFTKATDGGDWETMELSVAHLGCSQGATMAAILQRAAERGWSPCPLELGPHLRLQWLDQPDDGGDLTPQHRAPCGSVTVMSRPLSPDEAVPKGFYLRHCQGTLWLRGYWSTAEHLWNPQDRLIFCRPLPTARPHEG
jgi:hypothetical protein